MDSTGLAEAVLAALDEAGRPLATHELLDALDGDAQAATESETLERIVGLVEEGVLATRSDHGTVYFLPGPATSE